MKHWRIKLIIWRVSMTAGSSKRNIRRIFGDCKPYRKDSEGGRIESQGFPVCDTYRSYQFRS